MLREFLRKTGRRGVTAAAVLALAATGIGLSAGVANADGANAWYYLTEHPAGHGVGVYAAPNSESGKVAGDLSSTGPSGDAIYILCWAGGEDINGQGDVWYKVNQVYSTLYGEDVVTGYVYGAYTDGNWNYDSGGLQPYPC